MLVTSSYITSSKLNKVFYSILLNYIITISIIFGQSNVAKSWIILSHQVVFIVDRLLLERDIQQPIQNEACIEVKAEKAGENKSVEQAALTERASLIASIKTPFA